MNRTFMFPTPPIAEDAADGSAFDHVSLASSVVAAVTPVLSGGDPEVAGSMRTQLAELLASAVGRNMEDVATPQFAELSALLPRLANVARSVPVDVLNTYGGKPERVLELLERNADEGLLQIELERALGIPADYLSKVVRRLADADLLLRWAEGRHRRLVITGAGEAALARSRRERNAGDSEASPQAAIAALLVFPVVETRHTAASLRVQAHGPGARPASRWSAPQLVSA